MFNESRLLEKVAYGSQFGHAYSTTIDELRSGHERRNANWDYPRGQYAVIYQNLRQSDIAVVVAAHHACKGMAIGFRLKDWLDYKAENEYLGIGDGTSKQFPLIKTYTFGSLQSVRRIYKPVSGEVTLYEDGSPIAGSIDYTTGIVTATVTDGATLTWSGEFDVPVRFDTDELDLSVDNISGGEFVLNADIPIIEIRP